MKKVAIWIFLLMFMAGNVSAVPLTVNAPAKALELYYDQNNPTTYDDDADPETPEVPVTGLMKKAWIEKQMKGFLRHNVRQAIYKSKLASVSTETETAMGDED